MDNLNWISFRLSKHTASTCKMVKRIPPKTNGTTPFGTLALVLVLAVEYVHQIPISCESD